MKRWIILIVLMMILGLSILLTTMIGPVYVSPMEILEISICKLVGVPFFSSNETIIFQLRLPRIILGVLVGAALAVAGATMQGLFKNPMADPFVLGIASGAAVGAILAMTLFRGVLGLYARPFMAFIGATTTIAFVYNIAKVRGRLPMETLLLSGIAIGYFLYAIEWFILLTSNQSHQMLSWLMGWLGASNWNYVKITVFPIIFGILAIYLFARDMNIMLLGEDEAKTLGVSVEKVKWTLLILASFITAAAVSFSGIIMFVGLIIPHMMRILVGPDHRTLIPASAFGGGIFLILADALARMISEMLPVGIITAFFGAPFFIYLLRSRKRGYHAIGG